MRVDSTNIFQCLHEIFDNARHHGTHEYVGVQAKEHEDTVVLRFKNKVSLSIAAPQAESGKSISSPYRGAGLLHVQELMSKDGISITTVKTEKSFTVELQIPRPKFFTDVTSTLA
ncbi:hypothetical protein D9M72_582450 [compost metagenome]